VPACPCCRRLWHCKHPRLQAPIRRLHPSCHRPDCSAGGQCAHSPQQFRCCTERRECGSLDRTSGCTRSSCPSSRCTRRFHGIAAKKQDQRPSNLPVCLRSKSRSGPVCPGRSGSCMRTTRQLARRRHRSCCMTFPKQALHPSSLRRLHSRMQRGGLTHQLHIRWSKQTTLRRARSSRPSSYNFE